MQAYNSNWIGKWIALISCLLDKSKCWNCPFWVWKFYPLLWGKTNLLRVKQEKKEQNGGGAKRIRWQPNDIYFFPKLRRTKSWGGANTMWLRHQWWHTGTFDIECIRVPSPTISKTSKPGPSKKSFGPSSTQSQPPVDPIHEHPNQNIKPKNWLNSFGYVSQP